MTYRSGKSKKTQRYINLALGLGAFLLFMYFWSQFRSIAYPIVEPFVRGYGGTKNGIKIVPEFISSYFSGRNELVRKNNDLELTIERLENVVAEKDAFLREQMLLKDASQANGGIPVIVMYPIAEDVSKLYSTILLSKGFRDGVEKDGIVYLRGLQPVCQIVEVYDHTSLCELLSKSGRETEAVSASSSINLTLIGAGGGSFMSEVPKDTLLSIGEEIYLRSDPLYKIGTIVSMRNDKQATGAVVYVRGAYNPVTSSVYYMNVSYAH